ncbi:hypothetical protein PTI45_04626 [Paenibacillus nuruki]|uniref:Gfo/Idh/MocA-like oxidoreductase C-terminal domain-containing protein n=1 Tax=Paenibacillus nuruki TaxID=1886670 RepID=A0A1E3KZA9_9BACL|nr:hypothetical protein [Paenibacillus nuruki]ODP26040.1 hypothetical protein PTI45_04626 [Paenibacillus nuruki]
MLDLIYWLCDPGKIVKVSGSQSSFFLRSDRYASWHNNHQSENSDINVEDEISIFAENEYITWSLELAWASFLGHDETFFELYGEKGKIVYKGLFGFSKSIQEEKSSVMVKTKDSCHTTSFDISKRYDPYYSMLNECMQWLRGNEKPTLEIESALNTMLLIDIIYNNNHLNNDRELIKDA